jgi:curved DNA-binding protein CbpA
VSTRDPYEVLGVSRTASTRQIRAAYVARARGAHPDLVGQRGTDVMRALNEAWDILTDPERRMSFDAARPQTGVAAGDGRPTGRGGGPADGTKPFWTGAAGPPPGRPSGSVLDFGIFAGWSLGEIDRRDRGYLVWLRDRPEAQQYRQEIDRLVQPASQAEQPSRGRRR